MPTTRCSLAVVAACWLASALVLAPVADAYIYHLPNRVLGEQHIQDGKSMQLSALPLGEGPMFSQADAPFGNDAPYIELSGVATLLSGAERGSTTMLNVVFFNQFNEERVGWLPPGSAEVDTLGNRNLCCTPMLVSDGVCARAGHLIVAGVNGNFTVNGPDPPLEDEPALHVYLLGPNRPFTFRDKHIVRRTGRQTVMIAVCDSEFTLTQEVGLNLVAEFRNPYGYVPGIKYGYLIAYGFLSAAYMVMLLVYCGMCLWHRDKLIPLQLGVACVMLLGLVEVCTWFFTYTSKNASGVPVCDADDSCPPLTDDIMAAAVLSVGKRCVSRVLLLVVCLGYGVVKPKLSRGNAVLVALLGLGYFGFGTVLAMIEANSPDDLGTSMWAVPVVIFDLVFVCWIYQALETIRVQLRQANQPAKLQMYNRLGSTLLTFVIVWVIFALIVTAIAFGIVPLEWQAAWALQNFWDCIYLALLVCIAVIWAPGERTQLYALYSQPNQMDDGTGDVEMAGVPGNDFQINDGSSDDDYDNAHVAPYRDGDGAGAGDRVKPAKPTKQTDGDASGADADEVKFDLGDSNEDDGDASDGFDDSGDFATHGRQFDKGSAADDGASDAPKGDGHSNAAPRVVHVGGGDAVLGGGADILDSGSDDGDGDDKVVLTAPKHG